MAEVKLLVEKRRDGIDVLTMWLPRIALAILFVSVGTDKFAARGMWVRVFDDIGFGQWFRYLTGVMQVGGAVLLLIPAAAAAGFILLGCTMTGAVAFWILTGHAFGAVIPGALLLVIVGVGWGEVARLVGNGFISRGGSAPVR
jgi:putative oxidoreductase